AAFAIPLVATGAQNLQEAYLDESRRDSGIELSRTCPGPFRGPPLARGAPVRNQSCHSRPGYYQCAYLAEQASRIAHGNRQAPVCETDSAGYAPLKHRRFEPKIPGSGNLVLWSRACYSSLDWEKLLVKDYQFGSCTSQRGIAHGWGIKTLPSGLETK